MAGIEVEKENVKSEAQALTGWIAVENPKVPGELEVGRVLDGKVWEETDIDIEISVCGVCGSDIHTLRNGWGPTMFPCILGHEIVGTAIRVGKEAVGGIKVGDRVGVGAQVDCCMRPDCDECQRGIENYCPRQTPTYNGRHRNGSKAWGGYADYCRVPSSFVVKIPDGLLDEDAAPMLCAGVTAYAPLVDNGAGPGKKVGIIGIGGLGHFGILFAKALKCDQIVAISRRSDKREDALKMGADLYIATAEEKDWCKKHERSLDLIICTVSFADMPLDDYLLLLRARGHFIQLGIPDDRMPGLHALNCVEKGVNFGFSDIGSPKEIREMLLFAEREKVKPWVEVRSMAETNEVLKDFNAGKPRYRYVLDRRGFAPSDVGSPLSAGKP